MKSQTIRVRIQRGKLPFDGHWAYSGTGVIERQWTILPLPKGEGRGEGEPSVAHPTVHSVNSPRSAARLCATLVVLLATGLVGRAQNTNTVARPDYQSFKIITDRNIFDPNRSSRSSRTRTEEAKPARVESFALVGTMSYENGTYAFFDGTGSSYRKAIKTGDTIAGYKVAGISADHVKLEANGQQIELSVGVQMRKQGEGEWQLAGRAESFGTSSPATAATEKTESASGGEESDVLKKLMQKREQELK